MADVEKNYIIFLEMIWSTLFFYFFYFIFLFIFLLEKKRNTWQLDLTFLDTLKVRERHAINNIFSVIGLFSGDQDGFSGRLCLDFNALDM